MVIKILVFRLLYLENSFFEIIFSAENGTKKPH